MKGKVFTEDEKHEVGRVLEKVYEVLEKTDNAVSVQIGHLGVNVYAYNGPFSDDAEFCMNEIIYFDFCKEKADEIIGKLNVLLHFNKKETDTTNESDACDQEYEYSSNTPIIADEE